VRYNDAQGKERLVFVSGGFAEALPDKVTILAESAERRRDINVERAKAAMKRAEERLAEERSRDDIDFTRARVALQRAIQRISVAESR
jgi:F-type H+-transporting ATPase subunit epsilon